MLSIFERIRLANEQKKEWLKKQERAQRYVSKALREINKQKEKDDFFLDKCL